MDSRYLKISQPKTTQWVKKQSDNGKGQEKLSYIHEFETEAIPPMESNSNVVLPVDKYRLHILERIESNQVVCIQGETGSGKSTRIPVFILEESRSKNKRAKIVVTQPRRISCTSVAKRVAEEMNEKPGETVGYKIRGKQECSSKSSIIFCTAGFLLSSLTATPSQLDQFTHIILDEIHERSLDMDLLCLLIKLKLQFDAETSKSLKIIIMSATLEGNIYTEYFNVSQKSLVPQTFVGAKRFPVQIVYLDDLISSDVFNNSIFCQLFGGPKSQRKLTLSTISNNVIKNSAEKFKLIRAGNCVTSLKMMDEFGNVVYDLLKGICKGGHTVLIFLPGMADINSLYDVLMPLEKDLSFQSRLAGLSYKIFFMHSLIPQEEQAKAFEEPGPYVIHVILSTNIAETSVTLPSVSLVIDYCLKRELIYSQKDHVSSLCKIWASKAACNQRCGRAGRTMPGVVIRLVSGQFFQRFREFDTPEINNVSLEKAYLQVKCLCDSLKENWGSYLFEQGSEKSVHNHADDFFAKPSNLFKLLINAPAEQSVKEAINLLYSRNALSCIEEEDAVLTTLGSLAMKLPVDVQVSRLIYISSLLGVLVDGVILAGVLISDDPFSKPFRFLCSNDSQYSRNLVQSFMSRCYFDDNTYSEPIMIRNLFIQWYSEFVSDILKPTSALSTYSRSFFTSKIRRSVLSFSYTFNIHQKRMLELIGNIADIGSRVQEGMISIQYRYHTSEESVYSGMREYDSVFLPYLCFTKDKLYREYERPDFSRMFHRNPLYLKSVLAISFHPQLLLGGNKVMLKSFSNKGDFYAKGCSTDREGHKGTDLSCCVNLEKFGEEYSKQPEALSKAIDNICLSYPGKAKCSTIESVINSIEINGGKTIIEFIPNNPVETFWMTKKSFASDDNSRRFTSLPFYSHIIHQFNAPFWKKGNDSNSGPEKKTDSALYDGRLLLTSSEPKNMGLIRWQMLDTYGTKNPGKVVCSYRNPIGFLAAYPVGFRAEKKNEDNSKRPVDEFEDYKCMIATYTGVKSWQQSKFFIAEGVSIISSVVGILLFLSTIKDLSKYQYHIVGNTLEGIHITGIKEESVKLWLPVYIGFDPKSFPNLIPLGITDLNNINLFREALGKHINRTEEAEMYSFSPLFKSDEDLVDRFQNLIYRRKDPRMYKIDIGPKHIKKLFVQHRYGKRRKGKNIQRSSAFSKDTEHIEFSAILPVNHSTSEQFPENDCEDYADDTQSPFRQSKTRTLGNNFYTISGKKIFHTIGYKQFLDLKHVEDCFNEVVRSAGKKERFQKKTPGRIKNLKTHHIE